MTDVLSFEIRGLNGRELPLSYDLDRQVNIFFGPNGSGKTSLLRILHSAMRNEPELISNISFQSADVKIHSITFDRSILLSYTKSTENMPMGESTVAKPTDDVDRSVPTFSSRGRQPERWINEPETAAQNKISRWRHSYLPTSRLFMDDRFQTGFATVMGQANFGRVMGQLHGAEAVAAEDTIDRNFANALQSLWSTRYGDILGRVRGIQQDALQSIFLDVLMPDAEMPRRPAASRGEVRAVLDADRAFERMSSFLKRQSNTRIQQALGSKEQFTDRYNKDAKLRQIVNRIDAVEARIEFEMQPIQQLSDLVRRLFLKGKSLSFEGPRITVVTESDLNIGLERLSSGEKLCSEFWWPLWEWRRVLC